MSTNNNSVRAIIFVLIGLMAIGFVEERLHRYTITNCKVVDVCGDIVTIETNSLNSHLYEFFGDGFSIGDKIDITMHDSYTDNFVRDDEILEVKKVE